MFSKVGVWIYAYMDICIYGCMDIWICGYMDIIWIYGYMYTHTCIYIYTYTIPVERGRETFTAQLLRTYNKPRAFLVVALHAWVSY